MLPLRKPLANYSSANIKSSKTQLHKIVQSGRFSSRFLEPLLKSGLLLIGNVLKSLAKSVLTLFRMRGDEGVGGWGGEGPPTSFPPVTSTNVGFGPQNFLTFSFSPFATLVQNFNFVPSVNLKLLNLNQDHPSKKCDFSGQILIKLML